MNGDFWVVTDIEAKNLPKTEFWPGFVFGMLSMLAFIAGCIAVSVALGWLR